jgi:hypothetical protein
MSFEERLSHHGGREGHEDRNLKKMFSSFVLFVCFVVRSMFLLIAALRTLVSMMKTSSQ